MYIQIPKEIHAAVVKTGIWYLLGTDGNIPLEVKEERNTRAFLEFLYNMRDQDVTSVERSFFQQFRKVSGGGQSEAAGIPATKSLPGEPVIVGSAKVMKAAVPTMEEVLALVAAGGIPETAETTERSEGTPDSSFFPDAPAVVGQIPEESPKQ